MKKLLYTFLVISMSLLAQGCNEESSSTAPEPDSSESSSLSSARVNTESSASAELPNYSRAIAVNKMLGHGINFALCMISSFVHPMRLTFVEYFKNAEFEGGGNEYDPFRIKTN